MNVTAFYKEGWKEDLGNYWPVSLASVLGMLMEQITLSAITWYVQDKHQSGQSAWGKEWQVLLDLPGLLL